MVGMRDRSTRKKLWADRKAAGLCVYCGQEQALPEVLHGEACLARKNRVNVRYTRSHPDRMAAYRKRVRLEVTLKYGGFCTCCGEGNPLFLTMDHVNNDGHLDRHQLGKTQSSHSFYLQLRREPVRDDLQVLCFNCNLGRSMNGGLCPHVLPAGSRFATEEAKPRTRTTPIDWPADDILVSMVQDTSISQVARQLGAAFGTVRNRLEKRGILP